MTTTKIYKQNHNCNHYKIDKNSLNHNALRLIQSNTYLLINIEFNSAYYIDYGNISTPLAKLRTKKFKPSCLGKKKIIIFYDF